MFTKVKDPVCKRKIKKDTQLQLKYKEKKYYFDSPACLETFKENPGNFINKNKKGFIESLAEKSDGKPKSCH